MTHFGWLAKHPLDTVRDTWRAESAAFARKQDLQLLLRLAILEPDALAVAEIDHGLLKWGYVLDAVQAAVT